MSVPGMTPRATSGSSSAAAAGAVFGRLARIAWRVWKLLRQQAIAFGAVRIAVVCMVAWGVFAHERAMLGDEGERDAAAQVQTAERVASRSLADLDGALVRLAGRARARRRGGRLAVARRRGLGASLASAALSPSSTRPAPLRSARPPPCPRPNGGRSSTALTAIALADP